MDGFILASSSPQRRRLLSEMGLTFDVVPSGFVEPTDRPDASNPTEWAESLAYFKARAVAEENPDRWVLGADTIVVVASEILGKPRDREDARRMLELQARSASDVITGVALVRAGRVARRILDHDVTRVWMHDLPDERAAYLASGDWRDKAGAYGIQTVGDRLVARIEGSFSNVVGLPTELLERMLGELRLAA